MRSSSEESSYRRRHRVEKWDYTVVDDNSISIPLDRLFDSGGNLLYPIVMSTMGYAEVAVLEKRKGGAEWVANFNVWEGLFRRDFREHSTWSVDENGFMRDMM